MPNNTNENVSHNSSFSRQNSTQSSDSESIYQSTSHNVTFITDNASDISKAITDIGGYPRFGCAGHHLNLIAQAGFKQVEPAATLVKKCKRIVEHIRSSGPAAYLLIKYQKEFELPLHKVLQENNTRWWSILIMMDRIMEHFHPITMTLGGNDKAFMILNNQEKTNKFYY